MRRAALSAILRARPTLGGTRRAAPRRARNFLTRLRAAPRPRSEITAEGKRVTKLDQILLNGNNVALLVPGGSPDY